MGRMGRRWLHIQRNESHGRGTRATVLLIQRACRGARSGIAHAEEINAGPLGPLGAGIFHHQLFEKFFGFDVAVAAADLGPREIGEEFGIVGFELAGFFVGFGGAGDLAGFFENQSEIISRLGLIGHELDSALEFPGGGVELALVVIDQAHVVVGRAVHHVGFEGAFQVRFGFFELAFIEKVQGVSVFFFGEFGV